VSRHEARAARLTDLAARYGERLTAYVMRRVTREDAPDIVAATLMTAWRRSALIPRADEEAFWWLLAIARRTIANHRRGIIRRGQVADRLRAAIPASEPAADLDVRLTVRAAVDQLPENDRELLRLVYWDDLETGAAAQVLGISAVAARKRLQRLRQGLRDTLGALATDAAMRGGPAPFEQTRPPS
jgi:RNA polymerase sigma factor (sigma-70 family)